MPINTAINDIFNDLITINKNCITGYKEAMHVLKDEAVNQLFGKMILQKERYDSELRKTIVETGGHIKDKTLTSGFIYNAWMDITYSGVAEDTKDIYQSCVQMEERAAKAYKTALKKINKKDKKNHDLISLQKKGINGSLRLLRDKK